MHLGAFSYFILPNNNSNLTSGGQPIARGFFLPAYAYVSNGRSFFKDKIIKQVVFLTKCILCPPLCFDPKYLPAKTNITFDCQ